MILSEGKQLRLDLSLPGNATPANVEAAAGAAEQPEILTETQMREFTRQNTIRALDAADWRVSGKGGAAELLGVRPTTLADRVRAFKIKRPRNQ